jgi:hypothetical protein
LYDPTTHELLLLYVQLRMMCGTRTHVLASVVFQNMCMCVCVVYDAGAMQALCRASLLCRTLVCRRVRACQACIMRVGVLCGCAGLVMRGVHMHACATQCTLCVLQVL